MLSSAALSVESYRLGGRVRELLLSAGFAAACALLSALAFRGGQTGAILLLLGMVALALVAVIFWRPVIGLYAAAFLNIAMDSPVTGDPVSKYTDYFHEDLNTTVHAGIAFSPLELLLVVTTLAYVLRAVTGHGRLNGGTLGRHAGLFGVFLVAGYAWGYVNHGDPKIGLFEVRAPFVLVLLYFLVTNLAVEERQLSRLLGWVMAGIGVLAVWGPVRYYVLLQGKGGGADGAFGKAHENAIFFGLLAMVLIVRLVFGGTTRRRTWGLLLLAALSMFSLFEMERRAAFICLFMALLVIAVALFYQRRRAFFAVVPAAAVITVLYAVIFWNSSSTLGQPIRAWKSQTTSASTLDERDYLSNLYRINEKASVRDTIMQSPLTGVGFGRPFIETHPIPHLDWWVFQFYTPHAEVLWIWLKVGAFGFIAFWLLLCTSLMRAGAVVRRVGAAPLGFACLVASLYVVMILVFAYVDVGLANQRCEVLLGVMIGIIGAASRLSSAKAAVAPAPAGAGR